ncbi:MAG: hypothetical protein ABIJ09_21790 [Pseudomonadota bacterium]
MDRGRDLGGQRKAPTPTTHATLKGGAAKRYRSQLDRIFAGGGLPDEIKRQAPSLAGLEASEQQLQIEAVLKASAPEEIQGAVDALLAAQPMPTDPELLVKILAHPQGTHARPALAQLLDTLEKGRPANARLLKTRVAALKLLVDDDDVRHLADAVLAQL